MTPGTTVGVVGGGVVGERVRRVIGDRHQIVGAGRRGADRGAGDGRAARADRRRARRRGRPRRVDGRLDRRRPGDARSRRRRPGPAAPRSSSAPRSRRGSAGCSPATSPDALAGCDELHVAVHGTAGPACAREHHRSLRGWAIGWHDATGSSGRPGAGASCAGSPSRSGRATATAPRCPIRGCCTAASATSPASAPACPPPGGTGSPPACRCSARRTAREASARCGSRPAATTQTGARATLIIGIAELIGTAAAAVAVAFVDHIAAGDAPTGVVTSSDAAPAHRRPARRRHPRRRPVAGVHGDPHPRAERPSTAAHVAVADRRYARARARVATPVASRRPARAHRGPRRAVRAPPPPRRPGGTRRPPAARLDRVQRPPVLHRLRGARRPLLVHRHRPPRPRPGPALAGRLHARGRRRRRGGRRAPPRARPGRRRRLLDGRTRSPCT